MEPLGVGMSTASVEGIWHSGRHASSKRCTRKESLGQARWPHPALPKAGQELLSHGPSSFWSCAALSAGPQNQAGPIHRHHIQLSDKDDREPDLHCELDWVACLFQTSVYWSVTCGACMPSELGHSGNRGSYLFTPKPTITVKFTGSNSLSLYLRYLVWFNAYRNTLKRHRIHPQFYLVSQLGIETPWVTLF